MRNPILTYKTTLNCKGYLVTLDSPKVMGIINVTPDSFYAESRKSDSDSALRGAEKMVSQGASFLDVGGYSSRPGAGNVSLQQELDRVLPVVEKLHHHFPSVPISIDTFRSDVAEQALVSGASIVNDISGGGLDPGILEVAARYGAPYILMHMQGTPADMQLSPRYEDVVLEVLDYFIQRSSRAIEAGIHDVILDPGFGFGKSLIHNYQLLQGLHAFHTLGAPVMAGISRKSMVWKALSSSAEEALNGTTALHMVALQQGAAILRVHDVKEAMETVALWKLMKESNYVSSGN